MKWNSWNATQRSKNYVYKIPERCYWFSPLALIGLIVKKSPKNISFGVKFAYYLDNFPHTLDFRALWNATTASVRPPPAFSKNSIPEWFRWITLEVFWTSTWWHWERCSTPKNICSHFTRISFFKKNLKKKKKLWENRIKINFTNFPP